LNPISSPEILSVREDVNSSCESTKTIDFNDFQNINMEHPTNKKQDNFSWIVDDTFDEGNTIVSQLKVSI
jgi:hypothetical protein